MECKDTSGARNAGSGLSINRNIVECKAVPPDEYRTASAQVLIET